MFTKVLIANRGEIACRVIRTLRTMGVKSVAVFSDADAHALHVRQADEAVHIGPAPASDSYLRGDLILEAALRTGAEAIHPGYGFLSENPAFADECEKAGVAFIGPTAQQMRAFGLKHTARQLAQECGVAMAPGTGLLASPEDAIERARHIGLPVMLKATAGGGGIGMRLCRSESEISEAFQAVQRLGKSNFRDAGLYLEKFIEHARHIEVQIFGDGKGHVAALGERDCSAQRRNQKVIEETPAPNLPPETRRALFNAAIQLGKAVNYRSAGTVEFILDADSGQFYFLEVNTRLQVEHGVTELVTGIDLVEWMIRTAAGDAPAALYAPPAPKGAAIQMRLYAEEPAKNFTPSSGLVTEAHFPDDIRTDTWVDTGTEVSTFYDPLVAKLISYGTTRDEATHKLIAALDETRVGGIETNQEYLLQILRSATFASGKIVTKFLSTLSPQVRGIDVLAPGTMTTVQDFPGRQGYWSVGVPPSGPMDSLAFRLANRLVGNDSSAAGLEIVASGPKLRFNIDATIAVCGAPLELAIDGAPAPMWEAIRIEPGQVLQIKPVRKEGLRAYLAIAGGIDVPLYLGSRSTFTLGKFGGHGGRALRAGDVLHLLDAQRHAPATSLAPSRRPIYTNEWQIGVLYGPHGAPDFFTDEDIEMLFATPWKVHHNSDRTGVRLLGPHPKWARTDGGEAGLHPSNIHDNAYAVGTIDFTGNMPILLGPDGPSLGGFVCPATIVAAERWKMGQLRPGDTVRFQRLTLDEATQLERAYELAIETLAPLPPLPQGERRGERARQRQSAPTGPSPLIPALCRSESEQTPVIHTHNDVVYRQDGDKYLLVEYGPLVLDLNLRFRVHALMTRLEREKLAGIIDLTPGIRSLHIHFDNRVLPQAKLLETLGALESELASIDDITVPTRIVHLPLSWDDPATQLAIQKYMQSVRADAPWCPSNIEFIRRINGLDSIDDVYKIVFDASYLVLGLGDVYLGAPVATPLDPRHRLVTTKYNPARTWTAENSVGIGGAYMCVYGMEGPGGYQFVGRTIQMWNAFRQTREFTPDHPWLLRFFDQIRFHPVSASELLQMRRDFPAGRFEIKIEESTFSLKQYNQFLRENDASIARFRAQQKQAFDAERARWEAAGLSNFSMDAVDHGGQDAIPKDAPEGTEAVFAEVSGSLWKMEVEPGATVKSGQRLAIVESMKMEIPVLAPIDGTVVDIFTAERKLLAAGQLLFAIKPA